MAFLVQCVMMAWMAVKEREGLGSPNGGGQLYLSFDRNLKMYLVSDSLAGRYPLLKQRTI